MRAYFDELAGNSDASTFRDGPGKGIAEMLLRLMPPMVIADLGAGEGHSSQLLAQRARQVIAVDNSEKMVEFGSKLAREHGLANLEYRMGDLEALPIENNSLDLAFFSQSLHHAQHPVQAVAEAYRIFKTRRTRRSTGPGQASFRRGARTLCRPLAGLLRSGNPQLSGKGWIQSIDDLNRPSRAGIAPF